jgi:hypothetical protein
VSERRASPYLIGPVYDWVFFLLPPLFSILIGIVISGSAFSTRGFTVWDRDTTGAKLFIGALIHAHLVAVLFRSHGNPTIRRLHPIRFFLIPLLIFAAIRASAWIAITAIIVVTWWDVWHSGAQTFGFGRIYDRNIGNSPEVGRRLDYWLNHLLYAGPILGGATLLPHLEHFSAYEDLGTMFFTRVPAYAVSWQRHVAWGLLIGGALFLAYYVFAYVRFYQKGYRVSFLKVFLVVTTGTCSIYSWGFNSWGEAFFIMNMFHAVQYLALVWATEQRQIARLLGPIGRSKVLVCAIYLGSVFIYGVIAELADLSMPMLWTLTMVVAIVHFWYDGFIWSVAKKQI